MDYVNLKNAFDIADRDKLFVMFTRTGLKYWDTRIFTFFGELERHKVLVQCIDCIITGIFKQFSEI